MLRLRAPVRVTDEQGDRMVVVVPVASALASVRLTARGKVPESTPMPHTDLLLRELNHRVKNNFQIIVSLMNLKKRLLPPERREDIRFIEEHVQTMAVAYRLVYADGAMNEVSIGELLRELVSELRQIARLGIDHMHLEGGSIQGTMGLDQAISVGLYLAVALPPYLDRALTCAGIAFITADLDATTLTLSIAGSWPEPVQLDFLRGRLSQAYIGQLQAENLAPAGSSELRIRFHVDDRRSATALASNATVAKVNQPHISA